MFRIKIHICCRALAVTFPQLIKEILTEPICIFLLELYSVRKITFFFFSFVCYLVNAIYIDVYISGVEKSKFPAATNSMAIFRSVQVRSMDDTINEIAYQTSVNIGGHVFSGLLYDQGPDQSFNPKGDSSTGPLDQQQNLSLISASTQTHDGAIMAPVSASSAHDEPFLPPPYPFPLASFRSGMPYFSYPKP